MSEDLLNLNQTADDAEMVLLGGLMLETERFDTVVLKINHHDFQKSEERKYYTETYLACRKNANRRCHEKACLAIINYC